MGKGAKAPKPADVVGAARETGKQAQKLASMQTIENRPNQFNPWGSTVWNSQSVYDPVVGGNVNKWSQTETLNPKLQAQLDAQFNIGKGRSELAETIFNQARNEYTAPNFDQFGEGIALENIEAPDQFEGETLSNEQFNFDPIGQEFSYDTTAQRQAAEDAAYAKSASRLDPQYQQRRQALEVQLRNQGLMPGDQAWNASISNFNNSRNDAYEQARLGSVDAGRQESDLLYNQELGKYQANLAAQNQGYEQSRQAFLANLNAQNQGYGQELSKFNANLGAQGQGFEQKVQQNAIANQLRQQNWQEYLFKRGYSLDQINALLEGQEIKGESPSGSVQSDSGRGSSSGNSLTGE